MDGIASVDELLAPDTDEESIDISDEEFSSLLDYNEGGDGETAMKIGLGERTEFDLEEELDYEPSEDDDLIVGVTAEDMFDTDDDEDCLNISTVKSTKTTSKHIDDNKDVIKNYTDWKAEKITFTVNTKTVTKIESAACNANNNQAVIKTCPSPSLPHSGLSSIPSTLARVRNRLSAPSPAMVCWHRAHHMKEVERGLDMTTSIYSWHLFHAWSKEKSKSLLSDRFREMQNVQEVLETEDISSSYVLGHEGRGGGRLSDRFGFEFARAEERMGVGKRKRGEELQQVMRNKILRKLSGKEVEESRKERFGEVDQNFFDNVKYFSDRRRI